jgi:hypothetical protein
MVLSGWLCHGISGLATQFEVLLVSILAAIKRSCGFHVATGVTS